MMTEHIPRGSKGLLVGHAFCLAFEHVIYCRVMSESVRRLPDLPYFCHRRFQFIVIDTEIEGEFPLFFDYSSYFLHHFRRRTEVDFLTIFAVHDAFSFDRVPMLASDEASVRNAEPAFILQFRGNGCFALQCPDDDIGV